MGMQQQSIAAGAAAQTAAGAAAQTAAGAAAQGAAGAGASGAAGAAEACPTCGGRLLGQFCHLCGEERPDPERLSLRHFFKHTAEELLDIEHSKIFRTVRALLLRPGLLTNEWIAGRRSLYVAPLKLLLVTFGLYFFLYTAYRPVAVYDVHTMIEQDSTGMWTKMIGEVSGELRLAPEEFINLWSDRWQGYMSLFQITMPAFVAVVIWLAYLFTARRFVEHFVFSMHLLSFTYLLAAIFWPVHLLTGIGLSGANLVLTAVAVVVGLAYLYVALRRVYGQSKGLTLLKTVFVYLGSYLTLTGLMVFTLMLAAIHVALSVTWGR
jgi:Protein of unknown function (DUF3667)